MYDTCAASRDDVVASSVGVLFVEPLFCVVNKTPGTVDGSSVVVTGVIELFNLQFTIYIYIYIYIYHA